jgi:hypothetical protein
VSPPSGASIDAASGAFSWTPSEAQAPTNITLTVRVIDNGTPALSNTMTFLGNGQRGEQRAGYSRRLRTAP